MSRQDFRVVERKQETQRNIGQHPLPDARTSESTRSTKTLKTQAHKEHHTGEDCHRERWSSWRKCGAKALTRPNAAKHTAKEAVPSSRCLLCDACGFATSPLLIAPPERILRSGCVTLPGTHVKVHLGMSVTWSHGKLAASTMGVHRMWRAGSLQKP